jgi:prepilin-type N-terminal cleavage/methylation domain-containing protein
MNDTSNNKLISQQGFTLIELLVYISLSVIVLTMAIRFGSDVTTTNMKTVNKVETYQGGSEIIDALAEDLALMGFKNFKEGDSLTKMFHRVLWDSAGGDSSSWGNVVDGTDMDRICFKTGIMNKGDSVPGVINSYDSLCYFGSGGAVFRSRWAEGRADSFSTVKIMDGVEEFNILMGVYSNTGTADTLFLDSMGLSDFVIDTTNKGMLATLSDTAIGGVRAGVKVGGLRTSASDSLYRFKICNGSSIPYQLGLIAGKTYSLAFKFRPIDGLSSGMSGNFNEEDDKLALFISTPGVVGSDTLFFYPGPADSTAERYFEFTPAEDFTAQFTIGAKFTNATGGFIIDSLRIRRKSEDRFVWAESGAPADSVSKKNVKAVRVDLKVRSGSQNSVSATSDFIKIIPTPNNGV